LDKIGSCWIKLSWGCVKESINWLTHSMRNHFWGPLLTDWLTRVYTHFLCSVLDERISRKRERDKEREREREIFILSVMVTVWNNLPEAIKSEQNAIKYKKQIAAFFTNVQGQI
jgi:hypothetical protein